MSREELESVRERLNNYIAVALDKNGLDMIFLMLTDIIEESTILLFAGDQAEAIIGKAFSASKETEGYLLKGVVSRKKQLIPSLMAVMQE
jgi:manganese-dependent inorganic pyrophosphatase